MLQTATATAVNDDGSRSTNVRILFDTGSQRSCMTNSLKTRLGLKTVKTETLHLNTFGEKGYRKKRCDVVVLNLKTKRNDLIGISALNYPVICFPLPAKVSIREYPHLHGLQMADSSKDDQPIDLLIGPVITGTLSKPMQFEDSLVLLQLIVNLVGCSLGLYLLRLAQVRRSSRIWLLVDLIPFHMTS